MMFFRLSQDKKYKTANLILETVNNLLYSVGIAVMSYALSSIVFVFSNSSVDTLSAPFIMIFCVLFLVLFALFNIVYFKKKTGVFLDEKQIRISMSYHTKYQSFNNIINLSDIVEVEFIEKYSLKELRKKNGGWGFFKGFFLIELGAIPKNSPVVKITVSSSKDVVNGNGAMYLFSCENGEKLVEELNKLLNR